MAKKEDKFKDFLRFGVGLEDADDIIRDMDSAMRAAKL